MSIIEQAAKRLEELRRAGIEVPVPSVTKHVPQHAMESHANEATVEVARPPVAPVTQLASAPAAAVAPAAPAVESVRPVGVTLDADATISRRSEPQARNESPFVQPTRRSRSIEIDLARLAALGYVTPDASRSQLADEYRVIKRPLLTNALGKSATRVDRGNLIMITSAMPGEGKTFTSINLAISIAMELDRHVLLVDADVARPAVLERLALKDSKGLLDLLTDPNLEFADVMMRTNVERLSILPAGTAHARATEVLASDGMNTLLEELANRYPDRILIFDAPPLLPSTESRVLATHMGQVVVVVEAERTQTSTVTQALATLEACPVVMTLLNKVASSDVGSYYGYYSNAPS